jgi:hypothetical protein
MSSFIYLVDWKATTENACNLAHHYAIAYRIDDHWASCGFAEREVNVLQWSSSGMEMVYGLADENVSTVERRKILKKELKFGLLDMFKHEPTCSSIIH